MGIELRWVVVDRYTPPKLQYRELVLPNPHSAWVDVPTVAESDFAKKTLAKPERKVGMAPAFAHAYGERNWKLERYRHKASGIVYTKLHDAMLEAGGASVVVYQGQHGEVWVRPWVEFNEKFEKVTA